MLKPSIQGNGASFPNGERERHFFALTSQRSEAMSTDTELKSISQRIKCAARVLRIFRWRTAALTAIGAICCVSGAAAQTAGLPLDPYRSTWFFSAQEIGAAYQYQENYGNRMTNPLPAQGCTFGKADFTATYRQMPLRVPCRFISEVSRHLKEMLDLGAARYLFPLDADHAHLAVPVEVWEKKYSKMSASHLFEALLGEPQLVALYHTAEHLDPGVLTAHQDDDVQSWMKKRNVLGFFDGRPLQVLPADPAGFGVGLPDGLFGYGGFNFLANHRGALMIFQANKAVAFDVSLEAEELDAGAFGPALIRSVPRR
jgi:hypothetical protein